MGAPIGILAELKKLMYISKENQQCEKLQHLSHCLSVRIELVFERNNSCKSEFSKWTKAHFVANGPILLS
jgi:hypothetical protein